MSIGGNKHDLKAGSKMFESVTASLSNPEVLRFSAAAALQHIGSASSFSVIEASGEAWRRRSSRARKTQFASALTYVLRMFNQISIPAPLAFCCGKCRSCTRQSRVASIRRDNYRGIPRWPTVLTS
jgi:hypothetical protein